MIRSILPTLVLALLAQTPALADTIKLVGGDVLQGTIVAESDKSVTLDHGALGRIEVARDRIASIEKSAPAAAPVAVPPSEEAKPEAVPTAILPAPAPPPPAKPDGSWKFSLSLAMTGSKNDVGSNWNIRAAGGAKRESEEDRTTFTSEYYFQTADGTQTDNNFLAQILQEYMFKGSKWEVFLQSTYQNDEFQAWEQRLGLYAGPGYRLFEADDFKMKLRGGFGASYEFPTETWTPEVLLGEELTWKINDRSQVSHGFEIYPDLEQFGEYRFITRIDYEIALTEKKDLRATAGIRDVFDSYVEPGGDSTNDLKLYVGLKYDF